MKNSAGLRWIIKNSKKEIPHIIILSISNIVLALVSTGLALVSKYAIDAAQKAAGAASRQEFVHYRNLIIMFGMVILLIIIGRLLLRIYAQSLTIKVQARLEMAMRTGLFQKILAKKYEEINVFHSGELMNRMTSDIKIVTEGITGIVPNLLYFIAQFVGAFVVLMIFDWKFTMVFIIGGTDIFCDITVSEQIEKPA